MACGTAGIVGLFIYKVFSGSYSLIRSVNCSIAGMVSLCAGCNLFAPWASCVVAAVGAAAYLLVSGLMIALRWFVVTLVVVKWYVEMVAIVVVLV